MVQGDTSIVFSPRKLYVAHNCVCGVPLSPQVRPRRQVRVRATYKPRASLVLACDHRRESFLGLQMLTWVWLARAQRELTQPKSTFVAPKNFHVDNRTQAPMTHAVRVSHAP